MVKRWRAKLQPSPHAEASEIVLAIFAQRPRKYTGEPESNHLTEVHSIVSHFTTDEDTRAAAHWHDYIEDIDPDGGYAYIKSVTNVRVADIVAEVTNVPKSAGNRRQRKVLDLERLAQASPEGQLLKAADILANVRADIALRDPDFAGHYLLEKRDQLAVLSQAPKELVDGAIVAIEHQQALLLQNKIGL